MEDIFAKSEALTLADIPYARAIVGAEATALQDKFRSVWGYVNTSYWFPLMGDEPKEISEKFFIMFDYFEPYMKQFEQIRKTMKSVAGGKMGNMMNMMPRFRR